MSISANLTTAPGLPRGALRVARALTETIFGRGSEVAPARLDKLAADLGEYMRYVGPRTRLAIRASLLILQWSPVWVIGTPGSFTSLSAEDKLRYLEKAETRSLPLVLQGTKTVLAILWYELDAEDLPKQTRIQPRAGVEWAAQLRKKA